MPRDGDQLPVDAWLSHGHLFPSVAGFRNAAHNLAAHDLGATLEKLEVLASEHPGTYLEKVVACVWRGLVVPHGQKTSEQLRKEGARLREALERLPAKSHLWHAALRELGARAYPAAERRYDGNFPRLPGHYADVQL